MNGPSRILLGVGGGIAAYKSAALVRRLMDRGARVRVVMTEKAAHFVTATTFQALSGEPVRDSLWDAQAEASMGHIELARWADCIVVAPATADLLARLAQGRADDLLTTLCLASEAPIFLAPAMNRIMWSAEATQQNARVLTARGVRLLGPAEGDQACGETGAGRMWEPEQIAAAVMEPAVDPEIRGLLAGKRLLVNAGPTFEDLDPVRFLGNRSSGRMGFAIAHQAQRLGMQVDLVAGPVNLPTPAGVQRIDVRSGLEMHAAVMERVAAADVFIATAAVADFRSANPSAHKIKKSGAGGLTLELVQNPDILADVAARPDRPFVVGFAAETRQVEENARSKLVRKRLDMIAANQVGDADCGFEVDCNALHVLWPDGQAHVERAGKSEVARQLLALIAQRMSSRSAG